MLLGLGQLLCSQSVGRPTYLALTLKPANVNNNMLTYKIGRILLRLFNCNCNCNYILFTKLPWPGDSEVTFRSSSQAATCPPVCHTRWRLHTIPLIAERQAGKL